MHLLAVLSLKNRALIALVTVVVAFFGVLAFGGLKQELAPSISFPQLAVVTTYPGAAPEVVNEDVSTPVETAIQGVPGLESTSATSSTNFSVVSATFTYGTDLATAEQKITQAINRISSSLPSDVEPQVLTGSLDDLPVLQLAVSSDGQDATALAAQIEQSVLGELRDVDGVRDATLVGAPGDRVTITPDQAALAVNGLSVQAIRDALDSSGVLIPAGTIVEDGQSLAVQAGERIDSVEAIAALPLVGANAGGLVTIDDVAEVALTQDPVSSISRVNGEPALGISITKLPDANTVDVSTAVSAILPELADVLGGAEFTVVFDQAPYIQESINALLQEGLLGLVFAIIVIFVFLLSVRSTLVTAISIPTSVLLTAIGLQTAGYTLNILTLGALTIAIGRVVDDSIVVIENINRHLRHGVDRAQTIMFAVKEVATAITASTVTTVAVFLPLAFVGDVTGELFRPFALTVTMALLASLLVSLTIVPVLAYWFLRPRRAAVDGEAEAAVADRPAKSRWWQSSHAPRDAEDGDGATATAAAPAPSATAVLAPDAPTSAEVPSVPPPAPYTPGATRRHGSESALLELDHEEKPSRLQGAYLPIIRWTMRRPIWTLVGVLVILGVTAVLVPFMKTNFLGDSGQNTLTVTQTLAPGTSLDEQSEAASSVEDALLGIDGIETVQVSIGSSGSSLRDAFFGGGDGAITYSITTDGEGDQTVLQDEVRSELESLPDAGDISLAASSGFGASGDIEVDITAGTQEDLAAASEEVVAALRGLDALRQVESNLATSRPYVAVIVDRDAAAEAGYTEVALSGLVASVTQPTTAGSVAIDDTTISIYLDLGQEPQSVQELRDLQIPTPAGPVALSSLATVDIVDGPVSITTERGLRTATVSATPNADDLGTANFEVTAALEDVDLPSGVTASLGGVSSSQSESFGQLFIALLAAILIVYVVMVATFKSLLQPLLLLVSVPFAATGAVILQVATGIPLGVASIVGLLMLVGIVVTNAIVLVDLVNQYRTRGESVEQATIKGATRRLRPILMTALATIFALIPMAIGITGHGGFISQPLALVVIGGLLSSTLLTLVVLPTFYNGIFGFRERRPQRLARRAERDARKAARASGGAGG